MTFQIPETIEKKLSVKLKIAMVVGAVVVLVGATVAGYYFGQKKNITQPKSLPINNSIVIPTDTVTEVIPDPITVPDSVNNPEPEKYVLPTTTLPQEIEEKIVWLSQPKEIAPLGWLTSEKVLTVEEKAIGILSDKYYEVGTFDYQGDKGKVLILKMPPLELGTTDYFYIVDFRNQIIVLTKYSGGPYVFDTKYVEYKLDRFKENIRKVLKFDGDFTIEGLNFPEILLGPKEGQVLKFYSVIQMPTEIFTKALKPVFSHQRFGTVYTDSSSGGFYVYGAHGAVATYALTPNFFVDYGYGPRTQIIWSDGLENNYDYIYVDQGGCGSHNYISVATSTITVKNDLEAIGKTSKGDNIYRLRDKNHWLLMQRYNDMYRPIEDGSKINYEDFLALKPIIFWVDPFGRLIKLENKQFVPSVECGKPVIYLYPEKTAVVSVRVEPKGGMSYSDPVYGNGWQVKAEPNGQLTEIKSGKQYPYLFWEGRGGLYQTPERGFIMKKENIATELPEKLTHLGMNNNEIKDFMEFWQPRMEAKPYYFVTFLGTQQMNQLAPLTINPRPDTVVRILMDFTPLDKPIEVLPLSLGRTPERKGFTVIEWGGVLR